MFGLLRTVGLAFGLLGGIVASQGPEFAQQYAQRLGGALDELRRMVERLDADAAATGQTREAAIARLRNDPDHFIKSRGEASASDIERLDRLQRQRDALAKAGGPLERLTVIASDPDADLSRATYREFKPAVPTTEEGLLTGLIGFFSGWAVFRLIASGLRRVGEMRRSRRVVQAA